MCVLSYVCDDHARGPTDVHLSVGRFVNTHLTTERKRGKGQNYEGGLEIK